MATHVVKPTRADVEQGANGDRSHRLRLWLGIIATAGLVLGLLAYGFSYYRIPLEERVANPLHILLRPSGAVGLRLGQAGFVLMLFVYLYGIRKRWPWLRGIGNTRRWLDLHILMGIAAPLLITLHSSFKFQGVAGVAFWIMWTVVMSGFVGRYFYGQIPRTLNAAEIALKEMEAGRDALSERLATQHLLTSQDMAPLFRIPTLDDVQRMSLVNALGTMFALDLARPFHVGRLRRKSLNAWQVVLSIGGMLPTGNRDLEEVIAAVRKQSWLSMKIAFLSKAHTVFHIWHIVHRPFSYSLAVLAVLHVVTALLLGYF